MDNIIDTLKKVFTKMLDKEEIPVVALITDDNLNIIEISENRRQSQFKICGHAEINVINKMFKKNKTKNLKGFKLFSTLEPCKMCIGAIEQTGLNEVYYFTNNDKFGGTKFADPRIKIKKISCNESKYFDEELKKYFMKLR